MASQSGSETQGEAETAGRRFGGPLFPLGYKDAAYQWVSSSNSTSSDTKYIGYDRAHADSCLP